MRPVVVRRLPDALSVQHKVAFLHDIAGVMDTNRPRVVLDCSRLRECDNSTVHLLLHCLEEAMKRNGDVKLAAMPASVAVVLVRTGVARLFETFDSIEEAANSFHQLQVPTEKPLAGQNPRASGKAA